MTHPAFSLLLVLILSAVFVTAFSLAGQDTATSDGQLYSVEATDAVSTTITGSGGLLLIPVVAIAGILFLFWSFVVLRGSV